MLKTIVEKYMPQGLAQSLGSRCENAEEIRLRMDKKVTFYLNGKEHEIEYITSHKELEQIVFALAEHSVHSFQEDIAQGFFTVGGGVRVGVAGKVVRDGDRIRAIRAFTSLNLRMPREAKGISRKLYPYLSSKGEILSTLIISPPQLGKTTLLRDIVRSVSDGELFTAKKCTVVDERCEIAGGMSFDLGKRTDVLSGCPKSAGLSMALRSLSPEVLATDEIGCLGELEAINEAVNSGVTLVCTAHGASREEICERLFFKKLLEQNVIKRVVVLSAKLGRSTAEMVTDGNGTLILKHPISLKESAS